MTIVIRIDYPEKDPQGIKEAVAMRLEDLGRGIHVVEVREEQRQVSLWEEDKNG